MVITQKDIFALLNELNITDYCPTDSDNAIWYERPTKNSFLIQACINDDKTAAERKTIWNQFDVAETFFSRFCVNNIWGNPRVFLFPNFTVATILEGDIDALYEEFD